MHFFFIIEIKKAKDDAEEAYNSISEVAKKEANKMIYKSLLMILDIWNSYICTVVKKWNYEILAAKNAIETSSWK